MAYNRSAQIQHFNIINNWLHVSVRQNHNQATLLQKV